MQILAAYSGCHRLWFYKDLETPIPTSEIHPHWLYNCSWVSNTAHVEYPKEPEIISRCQYANKIAHPRGSGKDSTQRDSTWSDQIEQSQHRRGQQVSGFAEAA